MKLAQTARRVHSGGDVDFRNVIGIGSYCCVRRYSRRRRGDASAYLATPLGFPVACHCFLRIQMVSASSKTNDDRASVTSLRNARSGCACFPVGTLTTPLRLTIRPQFPRPILPQRPAGCETAAGRPIGLCVPPPPDRFTIRSRRVIIQRRQQLIYFRLRLAHRNLQVFQAGKHSKPKSSQPLSTAPTASLVANSSAMRLRSAVSFSKSFTICRPHRRDQISASPG
jgi:hypothetical protein